MTPIRVQPTNRVAPTEAQGMPVASVHHNSIGSVQPAPVSATVMMGVGQVPEWAEMPLSAKKIKTDTPDTISPAEFADVLKAASGYHPASSLVLGLCLGLSPDFLETLVPKSDQQVAEECLNLALQRAGDQLTLNNLCLALQEITRCDSAIAFSLQRWARGEGLSGNDPITGRESLEAVFAFIRPVADNWKVIARFLGFSLQIFASICYQARYGHAAEERLKDIVEGCRELPENRLTINKLSDIF